MVGEKKELITRALAERRRNAELIEQQGQVEATAEAEVVEVSEETEE
jgi:hypothetical protein